jgi:hypothetical protein
VEVIAVDVTLMVRDGSHPVLDDDTLLLACVELWAFPSDVLERFAEGFADAMTDETQHPAARECARHYLRAVEAAQTGAIPDIEVMRRAAHAAGCIPTEGIE